jgi:glycosyltransferase involved in cell wall biosynthesis
MTALRVAVVMPPPTDLAPELALNHWVTLTRSLEALKAGGEIDPVGCCRSSHGSAKVTRHGVTYYFETDDRRLARRVAATQPGVVHVHGLGFTRLLTSIGVAVGRDVPIVLQHHGEQPPTTLRARVGQRLASRWVSGYLFTGVAQADTFRRAGTIRRSAAVHEVLESASHLDQAAVDGADPLPGAPSVLWVGRLIDSKDPLCAVRALHEARRLGSDAELHMVATDRSLEAEVRRLVSDLNLHAVVHIKSPVALAEMPRWYRAADVYLSTSHREGSNFSLIEGLGFGCRPVVTEIPSHNAIVGDLAARFTVGDAAGAGLLIAAAATPPRAVVVDHASRNLSWSAVATQLTRAYRGSLKA